MDDPIYDVVIIGAGPAGLQAAVHAVRKKATVLVLGRFENSSLFRAHVENYLCVDGVLEGKEMLAIAAAQVQRFGAEHWPEDVLAIRQEEELFSLDVSNGRKVRCYALVIATGTSRKKLKVKGEKELAGRGVSYCVDCDANFFRNARVAVVGEESAAADGALTLTKYASEVFLIARKLEVSADLEKRLQQSKVQVLSGTWVKEISGEQAVTGVVLENDEQLEVEGVFIELGAKGALELATTLGVMLDAETFTHIATDKKQRTNMDGIYAAGDIAGQPYQVAKAVGEGCVAGWEAANYARVRRR